MVKYSIAVMMYLSLDLIVCGLIGPKKHISHFSNTRRVTWGIRGISSLLLGFPTL